LSEYDNNFNQLQQLYKIVQPTDLVGRFKVEKFSKVKPDAGVLGELLRIFVDTCDSAGSGLLRFEEIKQRVEALANEDDTLVAEIRTGVSFSQNVKIYDDVNAVLGKFASKKKGATTLHVVALNTPMLGISLRDTNRIGVFLNAIPSVELARCVPRLEVKFDLEFPGQQDKTNDGTFAAALSAQSTTLLRYLNGASKYGSADVMMAKGALSKVDLSSKTNKSTTKEEWKTSSQVSSGMELFTTPQTLTSPDATLLGQNRHTPVIDRFASLMSIESLEITATPGGAGTFSTKTAKLNLVVHDRSRLHEVAALIKPDAYSRSTVSLTYGWSHPDRSGNNPIGDLINQMVVHDEKYIIANSTYSFGATGGCRIVLRLSMKGSAEMGVIRIADNDKYNDLNTQLHTLSEVIRDAQTHVPGLTKPEHFKEDIRVYQVINAAANNEGLIENFSANDENSLNSLINQLKTGANKKKDTATLNKLDEVLTALKDFLTGSKKKNAYWSVDKKNKNKMPRIDDLLGDKFKFMIGHQADGNFAEAMDPYLDENALYWQQGSTAESKEEIVKRQKGDSKKPTKFISLAKLLLFYVGLPLQSLASIDEVQFVYYPLNSEAGYAGGTSLAGFPVEVQYFREVLADVAKRKGNANLTTREFVQLLNDTVLSDVRHPAYGMREVYNPRDPTKPMEVPEITKGQNHLSVQNKLAEATGGVFRKPVVELQIECRGGRPLQHGETQTQKGDLRIVRIHVHDKLASAYDPTLKVLQAQQGLESISKGDDSSFAQLQQVAQQIGLDLSTKGFKSADDLKRFITQVVPVLSYGANASGIIAATMQTMQNQDLFTVNIQNAMGPQHNSEPSAASTSAIPLRVGPATLDLTLIGCPLLNPAQQFFVDFNTGTTIDDLYTLTHLSHTIASGKFESTAKLIPMNAYGSYESVASKVKNLKEKLDELIVKTNPLKTWG